MTRQHRRVHVVMWGLVTAIVVIAGVIVSQRSDQHEAPDRDAVSSSTDLYESHATGQEGKP